MCCTHFIFMCRQAYIFLDCSITKKSCVIFWAQLLNFPDRFNHQDTNMRWYTFSGNWIWDGKSRKNGKSSKRPKQIRCCIPKLKAPDSWVSSRCKVYTPGKLILILSQRKTTNFHLVSGNISKRLNPRKSVKCHIKYCQWLGSQLPLRKPSSYVTNHILKWLRT